MRRIAIMITLLALGCPPPAAEKPGSPSNPVETCEEVGQVCKMGDSPLGVCNKSKTECATPSGCFVCTPQH